MAHPYCNKNCKFRKSPDTNKAGFCEAGFPAQPTSEKTTENMIWDSGIGFVCFQNPWKSALIARNIPPMR